MGQGEEVLSHEVKLSQGIESKINEKSSQKWRCGELGAVLGGTCPAVSCPREGREMQPAGEIPQDGQKGCKATPQEGHSHPESPPLSLSQVRAVPAAGKSPRWGFSDGS